MADNDIIDFYKKADNDNKPEEPLKEQKETPEPVVSESVSIPAPESNDPFDKFLFNLAEKLKTEKKITEQQQQQFNERVVRPTTNPEDPFAKFLESFAGLVKQDENINKEENIKEATIDFINKLKNDDFFDYKKEEPKEEVKLEPKKKPKKYLPPKFVKKIEKVEEDIPVIEQSTEPEPEQLSNPYVKELQSTEKKKSKVEDKISGLSDIKKIIAQQVQEQLSKYPNLGFTGGGGGTNAVQYAEGGTMNGNLTVNGTVNASTYLSGGTNLLNILSSSGGGGGAADRLISGPSQFILDPDGKLHPLDNDLLTLQSENAALSAYTRVVLSPYGFFAYDNNSNSITFDSVSDDIVITSQDLYEWSFNSEGKFIGPSGTLAVSGNVDVTNRFLSGGVDLADIFITSAEESQTLSYSESAEQLSIARGNSVSLSSLSDKSYANLNFLKLSGGIISGNLTVQGNISALGTATFANTIFTTTSALSVVNTGPGPALYVYQASGPYDVASFYDGDGIEVLHVGNAGPGGFGKVGVNESFPNEELTVRGSISATEVVYAENGNSTNWNTAYQNISSQSLNTTDNVQFNQIDFGTDFNLQQAGLFWGNTLIFEPETATFYDLNGNYAFAPNLDNIDFGKPLYFSSPQIIADTRTNLGLGSADNVEFANIITQSVLYPDGNGSGFSIQNGEFYENGTVAAVWIGTEFIFEKPINFTGPNAVYDISQTRTNLGLGSADNVEFNQVNANVYLSGGTNLLNILSSSGGGGGDPAVNTVVYTYSATWIDTSTVVQNNSASWAAGGGGATEKRFDFVTTGGIDYSYSGTAPQYTIETSPTWKLIRLTYANNGTISNQASAIDSWTGRLTATYV